VNAPAALIERPTRIGNPRGVASPTMVQPTLGGAPAFAELERHRRELTGYCYRMLGSPSEAEDAVQETLLNAWRARDRFEGRAALRTWLYRIATNVCLNMLKSSQRRALPTDVASPATADAPIGEPLPASAWVEPIPDSYVLAETSDPADVAVSRESIRLAFVAALQRLPARQRAVLILRDVLTWKAAETADLLGTTVVAVNSALERARETLGTDDAGETFRPLDQQQQALLSRYVDAFERFDLDALTSLLHLDATLSMTPFKHWLRGPDEMRRWYEGQGSGCHGSKLCPLVANGTPAFGQYRPGGKPWALHVVHTSAGLITAIHSFVDTQRLFPLFGLPLEANAEPVSV
jgi:RNA polymerase sigma-70 factor, ECF subfamily